MIVAYIDSHRERFGVEPICAELSQHGITIAPSTYHAHKVSPVSPAALEEACGHAARLLELRADTDKAGEPFEIITALSDAFLPEQFATAREAGITEVWTMPWAYYSGLDATLEQKLDGMRRFAEEIMAPATR